MSSSEFEFPARKDPFSLLKAIVVGLALGFAVVIIAPRIFPERNAPALGPDGNSVQTLPSQSASGKVEIEAPVPPLSGTRIPVEEPSSPLPQQPQRRASAPPIPAQPAPPAALETQAPAIARPENLAVAPPAPPVPDVTVSSAPSVSRNATETPADQKAATGETVAVPPANEDGKPLPATALAAALKPLLDLKLTDDDAEALKKAISSARSESDDAKQAVDAIKDASAKTFAIWRRVYVGDRDFDQGLAFARGHVDFPPPPPGLTNERSLFLSDASTAEVLRFFSHRTPSTAPGFASLAGALIDSGQQERGQRLISFVWSRFLMDRAVEQRFAAKLGRFLSKEDQARRQALLAVKRKEQDEPATAARKHSHSGDGKGGIVTVGAKAAELPSFVERVRHKKRKRKEDDDDDDKTSSKDDTKKKTFKLRAELSANAQALFARLKSLRAQDADARVWSLLITIDPAKADLDDPDKWWAFRRVEVRDALDNHHPKAAYKIASRHGPLVGETGSEAEFLAGWIALRYLNDAKLAEPHFKASLEMEGLVRDQARASYWLGRTALQLGRRREAERHFRSASEQFFTYYGSLSQQALRKISSCVFRQPPEVTPQEIAAFMHKDAFKALIFLKQLDLQNLLLAYALELARQIEQPADMMLFLEVLDRVAPGHVPLRAAKIALVRGFAVEAYAYPMLLPKVEPLGSSGTLDPALVAAAKEADLILAKGTTLGEAVTQGYTLFEQAGGTPLNHL